MNEHDLRIDDNCCIDGTTAALKAIPFGLLEVESGNVQTSIATGALSLSLLPIGSGTVRLLPEVRRSRLLEIRVLT